MRGALLSLIKRNKLNVCGIFLIVFLSISLGVCFIEASQHMENALKELQELNVEDFSFFPNVTNEEILEQQGDYWKAVDNKVIELAELYDFAWAKQKYIVISKQENIIRLFSDNRKINKYKIVEGRMPQEDEIMLDYNYASANALKVGDAFAVEDQEYVISAIVVLPDMISPVVDNTGKMYDEKTQCMVVMKEDVFETYCNDENVNIMFSGVFFPEAENDLLAMKQDENFYLFMECGENPQIFATVNSQITMNQIIMGFSMGILFSIAVLLVLITINEQIRGEYKNLGVLKALGYKNIELTGKYMFYFFIVGIPALLGYFGGHYLSASFYELVFGAFSVPYTHGGIVAGNMVLFVLVPAIAFALIAFWWAMFKVRKPALSMIYNETSAMANKLVIFQNKRIKKTNYLKGVKSTLLFSKIMVLIFVLFSGFALGVQIQFAYMTYNMTSNIKELVLQEYNYENNVHFAKAQSDFTKYEDSLKYLSETVRLKTKDDYHSLNLYVIDDQNTQMLDLRTENGTEIDVQQLNGVVINEWMRIKYDLKEGDEIIIVLDSQEYSVAVAAVSQSVYGLNLYVGKETAKNQFGMDMDEYNGIYTNDDSMADDENILSITSKTEMQETIEQSTSVYVILSIMLFVCGLVVGTITLMLSLFSVIQGNRRYIALMKVFGYTQRECNHTIINGYRIVSIVGFLVSIPYTIMLCAIMFNVISANSNMAYPTSISPISIICCLLITIVVVEAILWFFKKKLRKVSFREIMEG